MREAAKQAVLQIQSRGHGEAGALSIAYAAAEGALSMSAPASPTDGDGSDILSPPNGANE